MDQNQLEPQLLGECLAHSGAVQVIIYFYVKNDCLAFTAFFSIILY